MEMEKRKIDKREECDGCVVSADKYYITLDNQAVEYIDCRVWITK